METTDDFLLPLSKELIQYYYFLYLEFAMLNGTLDMYL
jgi:hypothetical protein